MAACGMTSRLPAFFSFTFVVVFFFFFFLSSLDQTVVARSVERRQAVLQAAGGRSTTAGGGANGVRESAAAGVVGICASVVIPSGYKCQEFTVETEDGYILSMQRMPEGRNGGGAAAGGRRPPVLLQHGVLMDGTTWLLNSPGESLAYVLADAGFDVWIANMRGTRWSRRHVSLNPSSPAFWSWSWDEIAVHDLPATFDFVYRQTGQKLHFVGHSMGTLVALASFSERRLVEKVRSAALLSPVAYLSHMTTPIGILAARTFLDRMYTWLGIAEFDPKGFPVSDLLNLLCRNPMINCYSLMTSFTGANCCLNESTVELFLQHEPQPTSTRNMVHLAQTFRDGNVAKFDYGSRTANERRYGQARPPAYNMSNIPGDLPLFLSYGGRDCLSNVRDVQLLLADLRASHHDGDGDGNHKLAVQYVPNYAHADFVMGTSAKRIVYDALVDFFIKQP